MPRAIWRGFLRLSLVSCPVYLSPATTKAKPVRLHQFVIPRSEAEAETAVQPDESREREEPHRPTARRTRRPEPAEPPRPAPTASARQPSPAPPRPTRIELRPHDPRTGAEVQRGQVVKAFETHSGQVVPLTAEDLRSLDVIQSTRDIHLSTFVPQHQVDPLYFETPFYLYPDGEIAAEAHEVIATAMAESGTAGLGRVAIRRREHMVLVQPRGAGLMLFTLRAADEVLAAEYPAMKQELDAEMVAVAQAIIERRSGTFDTSTFRDPYSEALQRLAEAKAKGKPIAPKPEPRPSPVADLMATLRRSLEEDGGGPAKKPKRPAAPDRRQRNLLLPVSGAGRPKPTARPTTKPVRPRSRGSSPAVRRGR